jgi:hypothetical protein
MKNKKNCNGFNQLFKGGEAVVQSVIVHNVHENFGKVQQGGTSLIMFGPLTDQLDFNETGKDDTGLGHWSVMTGQGDCAWTRIVCVGIILVVTISLTAAQFINSTGDALSQSKKPCPVRE